MMSPSPAIERKSDSPRAELIVMGLWDEIRPLAISTAASASLLAQASTVDLRCVQINQLTAGLLVQLSL